jgi:predicted GNAT family N-acyltransferase
MAFSITAFHIDDAVHMERAHHIRHVVFCDEQGVSAEEEWDDKDGHCEHFLIADDATPVGTARVRPYGPGIFKIERVAVLKSQRGTGAGKALMLEILARLRSQNARAAVLNAQIASSGFYGSLGFVGEGETFMEANIPHIHMVWRP